MKINLPRISIFNADHQGNTRVVFSAAPVTTVTKTATMESITNADFQNYPTGGSRNSLSLYNHTTGGTYSQLLNGGNNSQIGVAKSYKVYPGDKVKINAYAKYANLTSNTSNVSAFASALLNTFLLPAPLAGEVGTPSRALNDWGSIVAVGGDGQSNAAPRVSVNIIVFDKNYNFLDVAFDQIDPAAEQVGVTPVVAHDLLSKEYTVKEEGYVFMYIANENQTQVDAYFDDVAMTYTPTNIVQYNEYYPFGLQASTSWTRENNTNNFLYNEGSELNANTGWYETFFRGYDPALGRFMQVDPLAHVDHSLSPYVYAGNNPVYFNDPFGDLKKDKKNKSKKSQRSPNESGPSPSTWSQDDGTIVYTSNGNGGGIVTATQNGYSMTYQYNSQDGSYDYTGYMYNYELPEFVMMEDEQTQGGKEVNGKDLGLSESSSVQQIVNALYNKMSVGDYITGKVLADIAPRLSKVGIAVKKISRTSAGIQLNLTGAAKAMLFFTDFDIEDGAIFTVRNPGNFVEIRSKNATVNDDPFRVWVDRDDSYSPDFKKWYWIFKRNKLNVI